MLPKTKMATETEVEGDTTVVVSGTNEAGDSLQEMQAEDVNVNQTADQDSEEESTGQEGTDENQDQQDQGSETEQPEKQPRAVRRMEKLIDKLKEKTDSESELRRTLGTMGKTTPKGEVNPQLPPWMQVQVPEGEVTPEEFKAQVAETARNLVQSELTAFQQKSLKYQSFKEDLSAVESKYPVLNQDSEVYDPEKAKIVAELYNKASTADPDLRLSDFVEKVMSFHQAGQEIGKRELTATVIRRDAEAAVTPSPTTGDLPDSGNTADWDSMTLLQKEAWMKANGFWDE